MERAGLIARGGETQWRPCRLQAGPLKNVADWVEHYPGGAYRFVLRAPDGQDYGFKGVYREIVPPDPDDPQDYYSGKTKCHPIKSLLVSDATCHLCFVCDTCEGKAHDHSLADLAGSPFPPGSGL